MRLVSKHATALSSGDLVAALTRPRGVQVVPMPHAQTVDTVAVHRMGNGTVNGVTVTWRGKGESQRVAGDALALVIETPVMHQLTPHTVALTMRDAGLPFDDDTVLRVHDAMRELRSA
jgi:hypothetical protein